MEVLYWKDDSAACNIVEHLRELGLGDLIVESEESILFSPEPQIGADFFVVASTHKSESGKSTLSAHATGNWGPSQMGGKPKEISFTKPSAIKVGLQKLAEAKLENYEVCLECTHHGPTWKTPLLFIEIGSGEEQWTDKKAGEVVANAIVAIKDNPDEFDNYAGFGGTHYCPSFTNKVLENPNIAVGHVCPKYASQYLDEKIVKQALERSFAEKALIDWKGIKSEARNLVLRVLNELGIEWKKTSEV